MEAFTIAGRVSSVVITWIFLCVSVSRSQGQFTVNFDNDVPGIVVTHVYAIPDYKTKSGNGPNDTPAGTQDYSGLELLEGSRWSAQLYGAPGANMPLELLQPASPVTTFQTGSQAGFVVPVTVTFDNIPADASVATLAMFVWDNRGGTVTSYAQAVGGFPSSYRGISPTVNVPGPGASTNAPAHLAELRSFSIPIRRVIWKPPLVGWGWYENGSPEIPDGLTNVLAVASGDGYGDNAAALKADGTVAVWGEVPTLNTNALRDATNIVAISDTSALRADGDIIPFFAHNYVPSGPSNIVAIGRSVGLRSDGTVTASDAPPGLADVVALAQGAFHVAALKADGTVVAWGDNSRNQTNVPPGLSNVVAIAASSYYTAALRDDSTITIWGNGGQPSSLPLANVVSISASMYGLLLLKADGTVSSIGSAPWGSLDAPGWLTNVVAISTGTYHSMAILGDGPPVRQITLANAEVSDSGFTVPVPTRSGHVYRLEYKESLAESAWKALPLVAGTGGVVMLTDKSAVPSQRFYRVRSW